MKRLYEILPVLAILGFFLLGTSAQAAGWQAGTAKVVITPRQSMWMAGFGARNHPSEGVEHDLWAKALALVDPAGRRCLIVALDVCGIDRELSLRIRNAFQKELGIDRDRVVLSCSHTHCGPVLGANLLTMYPLDAEQKQRVDDYTAILEKSVRECAASAFAKLEPVALAWGNGRADFAVNRRNNKEPDVPSLRERLSLEGPVDHDVPVLSVRGNDRTIRAVLFGYACHCTVLNYYKFCGDYAGFAQIALESAYPGAQAMFIAGCGADQNALPRKSVEIARAYGNALAKAVGGVLDSPMRAIRTGLSAAYEEIPLRFGTLPSHAQVELDTKSTNPFIARRAAKLLLTYQKDGALPSTYPYPVQVWQLDELTWIILGGEVVVDYSLRLKRNLGSSRTWVSGYCNDVMAYIPSLRVLKEGGYEGETAMIYYGLPAKWSEDVDIQIVESVRGLTHSLATGKAPLDRARGRRSDTPASAQVAAGFP
jgi:hypothetical protein